MIPCLTSRRSRSAARRARFSRRTQTLTDLSAAIRSLQLAAGHVESLRQVDVEFAHGRDGRDVAAHLDEAIRSGRAAHAVIGMIVAKEGPW